MYFLYISKYAGSKKKLGLVFSGHFKGLDVEENKPHLKFNFTYWVFSALYATRTKKNK